MKNIDKKSGAIIRDAKFFESPPFWISDWDEVNKFLDNIKKGIVTEIGKSYGGRPIRAVAYGEKEPIERKCNISISKHSGKPECFFDHSKRTRPVILIISTIHGAEIEGCVSCVNISNVIEKGVDLRGRKWDNLKELAEKTRLIMVPLAQPDGRIRSAIKHLVGGTIDDLMYYGQGHPKTKQGEKPCWYSYDTPESPINLNNVGFLGGYYNDAGVNIDLDDFFSENIAPETRALLNLVRDETPDIFTILHSHNPGPWLSRPNTILPINVRYRQAVIGALVADRHRREGLRPAWKPPSIDSSERYFSAINLPIFLHQASGALPTAFEFPHGLVGHPYTFDEILDIGMTLIEEILRYGVLHRNSCRI